MKNLIKFRIDEKSLFYGTYNDYKKGQTATVATPLNQSKDENKWRNDIFDLRNYNCRINNVPEMLEYECKKSSHSGNNIDDIFVFDNILLDGEKLDTDSQFIMYMKRETDEYIRNLKGKKTLNTHLGRIKLHYPITFSYKRDGFKINNKEILNCIIKQNGGYAFVVHGFEYNQEARTLNFITSLIGQNGVRLSTVFMRKKGVGKKLLIDSDKVYENEYVVVIEHPQELKNGEISYEQINRTRTENGKRGEKVIFDYLSDKLKEENELYHTSIDYPQSPYDMEYVENGKKQYVEVKSTSGDKKIFNMSSGELKFMEKYKDSYTLYMVINVNDEFPKFFVYKYDDIMKMRKEYPHVRFYV